MGGDPGLSSEVTRQVTNELRRFAQQVGVESSLSRILEIVSTVLLSVAIVLSAFSAWQATLWSGQQSIRFGEAAAARATATNSLATGLTVLAFDAGAFVDGLVALAEEDDDKVTLFEERVYSEEFKAAYDAWLALDPLNDPNAPESPFEMEEYRAEFVEASVELTLQAEQKFAEGKDANHNSDNYILSTVFFASVLFLAGVTTKFKSDVLESAGVLLTTLALSGAVVWLASLPRLEVWF